jgi:SAM-dependent methyltransferase
MAVPQDYENLAPYQEELCHEWRPARLDYVARVGRGLGLDARARLRICDLACGAGLSVLLQAAAAPQHEVVGIDLNPTHIAQARRRAAEAGLANAHFHNRAIEETDDLGLDEFDVVTMSGAYSWLAPQVRRAARAFVRRHLRPGGLFGLHMMTLPGWSSVEPLWKLAREFAAPPERDPRKRHAATVALLAALRGSAFMGIHPVAAGGF